MYKLFWMKKILRYLSNIYREIFLSFLAVLALIIFVPIFTYVYFAKDLTTKDSVMNKNDTGVILLDRNNKAFFTFYQAKYKSFIPLAKIPIQMQQAVIASEDKDFYSHSGFSLPSIFRALVTDLVKRDALYGGSTLTQQLVKNALLNSNKNFMRKLQEVVLAQEIERRYSKNEILEMYLNSVYFGEGAFGIENAAQTYFGKHAQDLTLPEASFLTAILPSPSSLSPFNGNTGQAKIRQKIVLQKMADQKYITPAQEIQAEKENLAFHPAEENINSRAPHFALMVRDELIRQFGEERISRSGFRVKTTIDLSMQAIAEKEVAAQVQKLQYDNVSNGAAVVMDPKTGDVKALVGSKDWFDDKVGKINMADTPRSVGSSFKPIVYAAGFEERLITPATVLQDVPTTFEGGYRPLDYDRKFRGPVTVRRALSNSLNIPAVGVMKLVGLHNAMEMAQRLGVTTLSDPSNYGLSLVLGAAEVKLIDLTNVYATFANQGVRAEPRIILSVTDKRGDSVYTSTVHTEKVLEPQVAFLISSILSDNNARAEEFGNLLTISRPAAVKTGTAEDYKDALTMGYTPSLAIGVWVGNNDNAPMDTVAGSLGAAPIWKNLMEQYLSNTLAENFTPPEGVVKLATCRERSSDYFISGTQPLTQCVWPSPSVAPERFFSNNDNFRNQNQRQYFPPQLRDEIKQQIKQKIEEKLKQSRDSQSQINE